MRFAVGLFKPDDWGLHFRHWGGKSAPARLRARIAQDEFSHAVAARMVVARCQAFFGGSGGISLGRARH